MTETDSLHQGANAEEHTSDHQSRLPTELVAQRRNGQRAEEASSLK